MAQHINQTSNNIDFFNFILKMHTDQRGGHISVCIKFKNKSTKVISYTSTAY